MNFYYDFLRLVLENQKLTFFEETNTNPSVNKNEKPSVHEEFINHQIQESTQCTEMLLKNVSSDHK